MTRSILHSDCNNFYASVECNLDPTLKEYPIAVCGSVEERHGIVLAKNYKAKAFNVQTGDAIWQAKQKVFLSFSFSVHLLKCLKRENSAFSYTSS